MTYAAVPLTSLSASVLYAALKVGALLSPPDDAVTALNNLALNLVVTGREPSADEIAELQNIVGTSAAVATGLADAQGQLSSQVFARARALSSVAEIVSLQIGMPAADAAPSPPPVADETPAPVIDETPPAPVAVTDTPSDTPPVSESSVVEANGDTLKTDASPDTGAAQSSIATVSTDNAVGVNTPADIDSLLTEGPAPAPTIEEAPVVEENVGPQ